jgi:hypothetical protein
MERGIYQTRFSLQQLFPRFLLWLNQKRRWANKWQHFHRGFTPINAGENHVKNRVIIESMKRCLPRRLLNPSWLDNILRNFLYCLGILARPWHPAA